MTRTTYSFQGQERDDEVKGAGNSYTTEFRQYDPRLGRCLSLDPLMWKFPNQSPYSYCFSNPIIYVDSEGDEPIKPEVGGYKSLIKELRAAKVSNLEQLAQYFGGTSSNGGNWSHKIRYIYSESWGWVDMRHFSNTASQTDYYLLSGKQVLNLYEQHERETETTEPSSAWDYEDLPSNLLGVNFESFLESDGATGKDFLANLELYFEHLDFVENPLEKAPNAGSLTEEYKTAEEKKSNGTPQNYTYDPKFTTKKQSGWLDERINEYKNNWINGKKNRRDKLINDEKEKADAVMNCDCD